MLVKLIIRLSALSLGLSYVACTTPQQHSQLAALHDRMNQMISELYSSPLLSKIQASSSEEYQPPSPQEVTYNYPAPPPQVVYMSPPNYLEAGAQPTDYGYPATSSPVPRSAWPSPYEYGYQQFAPPAYPQYRPEYKGYPQPPPTVVPPQPYPSPYPPTHYSAPSPFPIPFCQPIGPMYPQVPYPSYQPYPAHSYPALPYPPPAPAPYPSAIPQQYAPPYPTSISSYPPTMQFRYPQPSGPFSPSNSYPHPVFPSGYPRPSDILSPPHYEYTS